MYHNGKEDERVSVYTHTHTHTQLNHFAIHQKVMQYCKSTTSISKSLKVSETAHSWAASCSSSHDAEPLLGTLHGGVAEVSGVRAVAQTLTPLPAGSHYTRATTDSPPPAGARHGRSRPRGKGTVDALLSLRISGAPFQTLPTAFRPGVHRRRLQSAPRLSLFPFGYFCPGHQFSH